MNPFMAFHLDVGPFYIESIKSSACEGVRVDQRGWLCPCCFLLMSENLHFLLTFLFLLQCCVVFIFTYQLVSFCAIKLKELSGWE